MYIFAQEKDRIKSFRYLRALPCERMFAHIIKPSRDRFLLYIKRFLTFKQRFDDKVFFSFLHFLLFHLISLDVVEITFISEDYTISFENDNLEVNHKVQTSQYYQQHKKNIA